MSWPQLINLCNFGPGMSTIPDYLLLDLFNDTNNTLLPTHRMDRGGGWTTYTENFKINTNTASGNKTDTVCVVAANAGQADVIVQTHIFYTNGSGYNIGIIGRLTDYNNCWIIRVSTSGSGFRIIERNAGIETLRVSSNYATPIDEGTELLTVIFSGSTIRATYRGITIQYTSATFNQTATRFGLYDQAANQNFPLNWNRFNDFVVFPYDSGIIPTAFAELVIDTPLDYSIQQRGAGGTVGVIISGRYDGADDTIEASFNGGAYQDLGVGSGGQFSGSLTLSAGQGLTVRKKNSTSVLATLTGFGVGDVFVIAGQSNASAYGSATRQTWSHATLIPCIFDNRYLWCRLFDCTDEGIDQIDQASYDNVSTQGTYWPPLATSFLAGISIPIAFIPCALGGSTILQWQPGANHQDRTTLYGSMVYRVLQAGGVKAVLWHQGESDAIAGTTQATYNSRLDTLVNSIAADLGCPTVVAKIHTWTDLSVPAPGNIDAINAAIADAWADNANVKAGPDFGSPNIDDRLHFVMTTPLAADAAGRWWTAIQAAFYP